MRTKRKGPGCAATQTYLLVAGGVTDQGEVLASVEIIWLQSRSLSRGRDMSSPRSFFNLVPVGLVRPKILAVGGRFGTSFLKSTEFWDEEENRWEEGPELGTGRSSFGTLMIQDDFACTTNLESLPPQSVQVTETAAPLMNTQPTGLDSYILWRDFYLFSSTKSATFTRSCGCWRLGQHSGAHEGRHLPSSLLLREHRLVLDPAVASAKT